MPDARRDHRSRNLVNAVLNDSWLIEPTKLDQIATFLEMRAAGLEIDEERVRAVVATQASSSLEYLADSGSDSNGRFIRDGVEVLQLFGTMGPRMNLMMEFSGGTSTQLLGQQIDLAMRDPNVKSILLEVDSPGGLMTGTEELRAKIFGYRGQKPIVAVARGLMASAAYYVASAASEVVATPTTQVGSIGAVRIVNVNAKAYEDAGIKFTVFRGGDLKAAGNQYEPLTEERSASIQKVVDDAYSMFVSAVAENRGVSTEQVRANYGKGTVFFAAEAAQLGMIDRVASIEDVFSELRNQSRGAVRPQTSGGRVAASFNQERVSMNPKIKAALYALGLTNSVEASEELCQTALNGFFRGQVPQGDASILQGLSQGFSPAAGPHGVDPKPVKSHEQEVEAARRSERERCEAIRSRAKILNNTGFSISEDMVAKAIESGESVAAAVDSWTASQPSNADERPVGRIQATGSEVDNFHAAASDAMLIKLSRSAGSGVKLTDFKPAVGADQMAGRTAMSFVKQDLRLAGVRYNEDGPPEEIAARWLRMHGEYSVGLAEGGVTAGNYPNLLSAFANKTLDEKIRLQQSTWRLWLGTHPAVPDFNPRLVLGQSDAGYLPEIAGDGDKTPEGQTTEEALAWFKTERRGKKLKLTPYMVTQDQLGAFVNQFGLLQVAQDRTIDQMAFDLLVSNPTLLDGGALFNSTATSSAGGHANLTTGGDSGAPSSTTAKAMRLGMRKQPGIGTTDYIEVEPAIALVPLELEDSAKQTYLSTALLTEALTKATDATINVHRGSLSQIIPSGRLTANSASAWYTLADPMLYPVISVVFQTGYEGGKRESWWDPDTQCRYFRHETRVGVYVAGWRGAMKNAG